jgi:hypothetical protein
MTGLLGLGALTGGWALPAGALALSLAVGSGTYWVTSRSYQGEIAQLKLAQQIKISQASQKALAQFTSDWNLIHSAAQNYQQTQASLEGKFSDLQRALDDATRTPVPAICVPTAGRLSVLRAAIAAANSAGAGLKPLSPLPAPAKPPGR